jgi:RNA polymerase sigma-70 factor, ECF subfamily
VTLSRTQDERGARSPALVGAAARPELPPFETLYETYFPYVWRSMTRLGVPPSRLDDAVQEVFVVAHRKLGAFEWRSSLKTWFYSVALHVSRVHRREARRSAEPIDTEDLAAPHATRPDVRAELTDAAVIVNTILDSLDEGKREVFVLAELEELSALEIAEALEIKVNTVYSRLRLARQAFAAGAARHRAQDNRGQR